MPLIIYTRFRAKYLYYSDEIIRINFLQLFESQLISRRSLTSFGMTIYVKWGLEEVRNLLLPTWQILVISDSLIIKGRTPQVGDSLINQSAKLLNFSTILTLNFFTALVTPNFFITL
jgi:hypothetical protein